MGILAGDRIIKIEGKSTQGITVEEAVHKLRGPRGSKVTITISRVGEKEPMNFTITRDIIHIKSVPYAGMVNEYIGYIKLTTFSEKASQDVRDSLRMLLKNKKMKGLIFDLRQNNGGLLSQAVEVANLFLEPGQMVVYTKGRHSFQNTEHRSKRPALLKSEIPLVVLIDKGSASASEIVAGAVQDHDRGIILGMQSFGKGSVQTIFRNLTQGYSLKLTTAHYYTPSGRCINRLENESRYHPDSPLEQVNKDAETGDSASDTTKKRQAYYTDNKRIVYGEGGITPDTIVKPELFTLLERSLVRKNLIFNFAIKKIAGFKEKGTKIDESFKVNRILLNEFKNYIKEEEFEYKIYPELAIDDLKSAFKRHRAVNGDTTKIILTSSDRRIDSALAALEALIEKDKENDFKDSKEYITLLIKREILSGAVGSDATYRHMLKQDRQLNVAVSLLDNHEQYAKLITPKKEK
jgi:carboxyl-terminal processing protease